MLQTEQTAYEFKNVGAVAHRTMHCKRTRLIRTNIYMLTVDIVKLRSNAAVFFLPARISCRGAEPGASCGISAGNIRRQT